MSIERKAPPKRTAADLEQHGLTLRSVADQRRGSVLDRAANLLGLGYGTRYLETRVKHTERELVVARYEESAGAAAVETDVETFASRLKPSIDALGDIQHRHMAAIRSKSKFIIHEQDVPRPWTVSKLDRKEADQQLATLEDNISGLEVALRSNDDKNRFTALRSLSLLLRLGDHVQVRLVHAVIDHALDVLAQSPILEDRSYEVLDVMSLVDRAQQQRFEEFCLQAIADHTLTARALRNLLYHAYSDLVSWNDSDLAKQATQAMITRYGFKPEELTSLWNDTKSLGDSEGTLYPEKLSTMYQVELEEPGATRRLFDEFGIAVYDRYPSDVLITQDRQRDDDTLAYGVCVAARADHGLFTATIGTAHGLIGNLAKQLQGRFALRIIEVGGRYSLAKRHLQLDERYGAKHKIAFGIEIVHGEPDHMSHGRGEKSGKLKMTDLDGPAAARVLATYELDAPQVLVSCSTGREGGIAQKLSERSGPVTAPKIPIQVPKIDVAFNAAGKPNFSVQYGTAIHTFEAGVKVT